MTVRPAAGLGYSRGRGGQGLGGWRYIYLQGTDIWPTGPPRHHPAHIPATADRRPAWTSGCNQPSHREISTALYSDSKNIVSSHHSSHHRRWLAVVSRGVGHFQVSRLPLKKYRDGKPCNRVFINRHNPSGTQRDSSVLQGGVGALSSTHVSRR